MTPLGEAVVAFHLKMPVKNTTARIYIILLMINTDISNGNSLNKNYRLGKTMIDDRYFRQFLFIAYYGL